MDEGGNELVEGAKHIGDAVSVGVAVGTVMKLLPAIAALFTIIYTAIRIFESKTVQRLLGRDPASRALKSLYRNTLDEQVPPKLTDTLNDLK